MLLVKNVAAASALIAAGLFASTGILLWDGGAGQPLATGAGVLLLALDAPGAATVASLETSRGH